MSKLIKQAHGGAINRFVPGEVTNPNGRPPKILTTILRELTDAGYKRVSVANVVEAYELLVGLDENKIKEVIEDKAQPMIMRIVGKAMLSPKGVEMLEKMLDRAHGKPNVRVDVTTKGDKITNLYELITNHDPEENNTVEN